MIRHNVTLRINVDNMHEENIKRKKKDEKKKKNKTRFTFFFSNRNLGHLTSWRIP